jgi:uncharacterized caspase-like protein
MSSGLRSAVRREFSAVGISIWLVAASLATVLWLPAPAAAQTRRALLIGINRYHYTADVVRRWEARLPRQPANNAQRADTARRDDMSDLYGPLNDVESVRAVLVARYQFAPANVRVLRNAEATRDSILAAIRLLVEQAAAGDEILFFYAGHGSQRFNSLVPSNISANHLDQTIVPADANAGQFDIRNVELTTLFDSLLRKRAHLTLIFDSCNSGSAVRGALTPMQARYAPYDPRDALDPSVPQSLTDPARANPALFIAAAQNDQSAVEDERTRHGVFTKALVDVLQSPSTSVNASAEQILQQVQATLRSNNVEQVPVLRGTESNHDRPLLGNVTGPLVGRTTLPFVSIRRDTVILDGGPAMAIGKGSELRLLDDSGNARPRATRSSVRIRIVAQPDLATSKAVVIEGTIGALRPPALFLLEKWRLPESANLYAWAPAPVSSADLAAAAHALAPLRSSTVADWTNDPTSLPDDSRPLYTVLHDRGGWRLRTPSNASISLASITASAVEAAIGLDQRRGADSIAAEAARRSAEGLPAPRPLGKPRVFVDLPPTPQLLQAFDSGSKLVWRPTLDSARYALTGHLDDANRIEYAWISLDAGGKGRSPFPPRSDWTPLADPDVGDALDGLAYGLSRVTYWLTVTPQDSAPFPYHLALRRLGAGPPVYKALGDTTPNQGGEQYGLVLRRDPKVSADSVEQQWVYVFIIDRDGRGQLLFGQSQNHMPPDSLGHLDNRAEIPLPRPRPVTICPSYGVDTFILVASPVPLAVPARVFNFPPIREASRDRVVDPHGGAPDNWSIERLSIVSGPPAAGATALIATAVSVCRTDEKTVLAPREH